MVGAFVALLLTCGYFGWPFFVWVLLFIIGLVGMGAPMGVIAVAVGLGLLSLPPLRRRLVTCLVMRVMKSLFPQISDTERAALEAGVVWSEAELFSGKPNFKKLMEEPYPKFNEEEQAFIDGPLQDVCALVDHWKIWQDREVSDQVLQKLKDHKFFGLIIPKKYGGLGFSAYVHSEVVSQLSTRSSTVCITVMVPNSLGPAELLMHFGTEDQKIRYLPRLATGEEIPCFGLTEAQAGSDASAISSRAVLFKGEDGKIYMRMNWQKRWITLSALSTLIGLAFRLEDPDHLLGPDEDLGITCGLIPSNAKGVVVGRRHDTMGISFYNGPIEGHDVVMDAEECIIGGLANVGKGWFMLMECLGVGRGISLPALSTGGNKLLTRVVSNHASIRKQFGVAIGRFEGVEEPLARMVGRSYFQEAVRLYTISALDQGVKPPVVTAITKYLTTEEFRKTCCDAMDILGGAGISMGPRNLVVASYICVPISITVEGANILTRTLMIFGQGALRAHPYAFAEMKAVENKDLKGFDRAFWGHMGHIVQNTFRSLILSVSRGYLSSRGYGGFAGRYFQKLSWVSASYALMADVAMGTLGGKLKFKEKLTGRYADILTWMYVVTATLRRFKAEGCQEEDRPLLEYSMKLAFSEIQKAFDGIFANFDAPFIGWLFKGPIRWWFRLNVVGSLPDDSLTHQLARLIQTPGGPRDRVTSGIYMPTGENEPLVLQEKAFAVIKESEEVEKKLKRAIRKKELPKVRRLVKVVDEAVEKSIISSREAQVIKESAILRWEVIQVDDFSKDEYINRKL